MNEIRSIQRMQYISIAVMLVAMSGGVACTIGHPDEAYGYGFALTCGWIAGLAYSFAWKCDEAVLEMKQTLKDNEQNERDRKEPHEHARISKSENNHNRNPV